MQLTVNDHHRRCLVLHTLNLQNKLPRYVTAFLLLLCLQVGAIGTSQTITLSVKNTALQTVFKEITRQTGYQFLYSDQVLDRNKTITVQLKDASLSQALDECLKQQNVNYTIDKKMVIIKRKGKGVDDEGTVNGSAAAAVIDIEGKVVNKKGEPVEGASVIVKGTSKAAVTNERGEFKLKEVEDNAILVISGVNIETQEVRVGGRKNLVVSVTPKIGEEETVIVNTGYQRISKERIVGSFSQLDSAAYARRAGMNIIDRLDGTVPGVLFNKKGDLKPIQIRGISSLGANDNTSSLFDPLIIVDNFPYEGNLNNFNPNDIENITILKDAAAASIWGSRAGNGVIVITTKKGHYNQPVRISVQSNVTMQEKPDLYYYPQMSVIDFVEVERFLFQRGFYNSMLNDITTRPVISPVVEVLAKQRNNSITAEQAAMQIDSLKQFDLRNELDKNVYRNGVFQQHFLSLSGGSNVFNYALSVGYNRNQTNIQDSKSDDQWTVTSNNTFRLIKNMEIDAGINIGQEYSKSASFALPAGLYPYARLADEKGRSLPVPIDRRLAYTDTAGNGKLLDWKYRPLDEIGFTDRTAITRFMRLNTRVSYRFTSWLEAQVNYQYVNQTISERNYASLQTYNTRNLINFYTNLSQTAPNLRNPVPVGGILDLSEGQTDSHNMRAQLNFNKSWNNNHSVSALVAGEISEVSGSNAVNRFYGYDDAVGSYKTNMDYVSNFRLYGQPPSSTRSIPTGNSVSQIPNNRFVSLLTNASYSYKGRYNAYASARRDGANVFGVSTNNKWKPLWSVGAGWDISKESFFTLTWVSSLRLRSSYGYTGNIANALSGKPTVFYINRPSDLTGFSYAQVGNPPNPYLKWEEVRIMNIGIDFNVLKRLSGSFEVFYKRSTDVLSLLPFDHTSGISSYMVNSANLKGNGFEFNLNTINTTGRLHWETRLSISYAKTVVTKLFRDGGYVASDYINYGINAFINKPVYSMASYRWAGLDPATGDPLGYAKGKISKNYQSIFFDSIQNQVVHGSSLPLYNGYLNNAITWKSITLSANITYRFAYYFRKPVIDYSALFNQGLTHNDYSSRWKQSGDELFTNVPSMYYPVPNEVRDRDQFYRGAEMHVLKGDHIRLQDVRLDYNWTNQNLKVPIKAIQFFIYANNLNFILWKANRFDLDPDFTGGIGNFTAAPTPRTWAGGVNISF